MCANASPRPQGTGRDATNARPGTTMGRSSSMKRRKRATIRRHEEAIARDNVVFELRLFIGAIGKERCYVVKPRGVEMHLPSDLLGMNPADYAADRPDDDFASALNFACKQIKDRIKELGSIDRSPFASSAQRPVHNVANPPDYKLGDADLLFLAECLRAQVSSPDGRPFYEVTRELNEYSPHTLMMSAIKLERLGYIAKSIEQEQQGYGQYFGYSSTAGGIDVVLQNEARIIELSNPPSRPERAGGSSNDTNDDIPF